MAKAGSKPRRQARAGRDMRDRIAEAALQTLKREGFAGASARSIARTGGFSQAAIFYHFDSVADALLAGLDLTSAQRMERYREALAAVGSVPELLEVAGRIYREDLEEGHITVLAEMIAGASSVPGLGPEIVARVEPWIDLTEEVLGRVLGGSILGGFLPPRDVALAIVSFYLGLEMLTHLDGKREGASALFADASRLGALVEAFVSPGGKG